MKIYQIRVDVDRLRSATYINVQDQTDEMRRLGVPLADCWTTLPLKSYKPKRPIGLFNQIAEGEFILSPQAEKDPVLVQLLELDGEFLPVTVDGNPMRLQNITCFTDCLDYERSRWKPDLGGQVPRSISHPRFISEKILAGRMFRLKEFPRARYVASDPSLAPQNDFYQWYHAQKYDGLLFRLMWDSDKPDELGCFW